MILNKRGDMGKRSPSLVRYIVNWWGPLILLALGLALGAAILGPFLLPDENQQARQRLEERLQAWAGIRDLQGSVEISRAGEPPLRLRILWLVGLAIRLEIQEPKELAGEVYALRAVQEGWLLVHFRPALSLGLEARFPEAALAQLLGNLGAVDLGKLRIRWFGENIVQVSGLAQPFPTAEIHFGPETALPQRVLATDANGQVWELRFSEPQINVGLELRDLLTLDPLPTRWIQIPVVVGGA